jgi:TolB-like protein
MAKKWRIIAQRGKAAGEVLFKDLRHQLEEEMFAAGLSDEEKDLFRKEVYRVVARESEKRS